MEYLSTITFLLVVLTARLTPVWGKRQNVLFIVSDDMRPELGILGGKAYTPHLDRLASRSLLLKQAYVQQAVCSPSRTSLLTGRRPDTTRVHDLSQYWRRAAGDYTTLPQYFKEHGYRTVGVGKIFHPGQASGNDDPVSWSKPNWQPDDSHWNNSTTPWYAAGPKEIDMYPLMDMMTTRQAIKEMFDIILSSLTTKVDFFLAVGFHKPHLPFIFPERFLDYYPEDQIHLPDHPDPPIDYPEVAWSFFDELRWYSDIGTKYGHGYMGSHLPDNLVKQLRRAYYAAVTYTDSLVGEVLDALEELGLANDTIVSFIGDHGWQLGEHGEWCKHTNFELATHAPMMISIPGRTDRGVRTERLVEFVDLFPTLVDAAGLPAIPLCPVDSRRIKTCTEGTSLLPLVSEPSGPWKSGVFSQYPRMLMEGDVVMGYRIRTDDYSYTEWVYYDTLNFKPKWDELYNNSVELYDLRNDPKETVNMAHVAGYKVVRARLSKQLHAGWREAMPYQQ